MHKKYAIIIILIGLALGGVLLPNNFGSGKMMVFQIKKGQSLREISANLGKQGLIRWDPFFQISVLFTSKTGKLQAGCYFLSPEMNIPKIAGILSSGAVAKERVTIPEGFTSAQIYERLSRTVLSNNVSGSDPDTFVGREGYLFPDTYEIPYCMEQEKIIKMMTDNFNQKTANLKITPEIVIMASLLEKELQSSEDKKVASGILWKRLKVGMPLQVDADMWTYDNYGLPESPIANPGLESLEAALQPKESPYWYYLSAKDGRTIFSRTLEEHNIAKARYLR